MDSLDFYRGTILGDLYDRGKSDDLLRRVIAWIAAHADPDQVYSAAQLDAWARANGYAASDTPQQVAALLRRIEPLLIARSPESVDTHNMLISLTRYINPNA
jgi:hypothetical protein